MSDTTKIEWCDSTFNPWIGCTKVGPGCDHCYAEVSTPSRTLGVVWGPKAARRRTSPGNWALPMRWQREHDAFFAKHGRRRRVFCASLADVFDNAVPAQWRIELTKLILDTPHLDWLLVTKRIGNAAEMLEVAFRALHGQRDTWANNVPANVWLGITVVNQEEADRDIPKLLEVPAAKRFLSMEPLLAPVDLTVIDINGDCEIYPLRGTTHCVDSEGAPAADLPALDWVIVGGESGPKARPMHPDWARDMRDQCEAAGVPFLFKQWGEWTPGENVTASSGTVPTAKWFNEQWDFDRENLACEPYHCDYEPDLYRIGKKAAGRLLDGVEHNGFPEVNSTSSGLVAGATHSAHCATL